MSLRPVVIGGLTLWGAAVVIAAVAGRGANAPAPSNRGLSATIPAAGVTRLEIVAGNGQVVVSVVPDDEIRVAVDVSNGMSGIRLLGAPPGDASHTELDANTTGPTVRLRLRGTLGDGLDERWTVRVPARLAADVTVHQGTIEITGIEGGVRAAADAGRGHAPGVIHVDVPRGPLDLSMGVGSIDAHTSEAPRGSVDVRSKVGRAALVLDGHEIVAEREPGPGDRVQLTGDGPDGITVRVSVGDARVRIR
jgi:hypothetical protein